MHRLIIQVSLWLPGMLVLSLLSALVFADRSVSLTTAGAVITVSIPEDTAPGGLGPVRVAVRPIADAATPASIRVRVGMPGHGHWIGEEGMRPFSLGMLEFTAAKCSEPSTASGGRMCLPRWFDALFPMQGQYRIRVWLDYADGQTATSAADFNLQAGEPIVLVETQGPGSKPGKAGANSSEDHDTHQSLGKQHKR